MAGEGRGAKMAWWGTPGALIVWALIAAGIVVLLGDAAIQRIIELTFHE
jgi:hypothetical protein